MPHMGINELDLRHSSDSFPVLSEGVFCVGHCAVEYGSVCCCSSESRAERP